MANITCSVCGKDISSEEEVDSCLSCGAVVCKDDFDGIMGVCKSCSENGPYFGC